MSTVCPEATARSCGSVTIEAGTGDDVTTTFTSVKLFVAGACELFAGRNAIPSKLKLVCQSIDSGHGKRCAIRQIGPRLGNRERGQVGALERKLQRVTRPVGEAVENVRILGVLPIEVQSAVAPSRLVSGYGRAFANIDRLVITKHCIHLPEQRVTLHEQSLRAAAE